MTVSRGNQRKAEEGRAGIYGMIRTDGSVVLQLTQIGHGLHIRIDEHGHQPLLPLKRQGNDHVSTRLNALEDDALGGVGDVGDNDAAEDHFEDGRLDRRIDER
jgi:hypothetical protein